MSALLEQLTSLLFVSLPRRDQRNWANVYLRGLVSTKGRKTIRNISGGEAGAVEQNLQQFISKSPWDWTPVRRTLAQHLESSVQRPLAWVVQSMIIEKAGDRSVGVGRQFVPQLGRMANCQQATGIWFASSDASFPVEWSLTLPAPWTTELYRSRARIPDTARSRTPTEDALHAVLRMAETWQLQRRPVMMDVANAELPQVIETFSARDIPFVLKVEGTLPVVLAATGRHKTTLYTASARELIDSLRSQRRPVEWPRHGRADDAATPLVAATVHPVGVDGYAAGAQPLLLLGAWTDPANAMPSEFWIANIPDLPLAQLFLLAKLTDRVALDFAEVSEPVGIRDFEGRSFRGWHHHATLASIAHAAALLSSRTYAPPSARVSSGAVVPPQGRPHGEPRHGHGAAQWEFIR
ncbi:IS701 family transposase [Streptomyces sp. KLOTTS4A1]|uniref:IS701 family transposase n=1 Tax=Streptomyces sp. KLOTTS4A1 TaxID=3390996 RepID=UPI0039F5636C